ncbi:MAG: DNA polymerase III subunit beta [Mycobacteriales bacterium]
MKFRIERDVLAEAVAWTAHALPPRPPLPVLAGVLLEVSESSLTVAGFDYEVSTQATIDVQAITAGRALVSGRLLADITRALPPHPVELTADGPRVTITCGNARFSLPTMPIDDYPKLPVMPAAVGTIAGDVFATAVSQVAIAAGRDETIPMLTGVRLQIAGDQLTLAATDRYRLAERVVSWSPGEVDLNTAVLVPARTLLDAAKTLADADVVTIALATSEGAGEGMIGFASGKRRMTTRLLDAEFLKYQSLWPTSVGGTAELPSAQFMEAAKRVALVADRGTPVRLEFAPGMVTLRAGGDDEGRAEEELEVSYDGEPFMIGFNSSYLLDGVGAIGTDVVRLSFTSAGKPAVLSGVDAGSGPGDVADATDVPPNYRYLTMPMRLPG